MTDPLVRRCSFVEVSGGPGCAVGAAPTLGGVLERPDERGQGRVCLGSPRPLGDVCPPGVLRGAGDPDELVQPLHAPGALVVPGKLEAVHQLVSPAKYLAPWCRISRWVVSLALWARRSLFSASRRAIASAGLS